jgi:hypothetical protein
MDRPFCALVDSEEMQKRPEGNQGKHDDQEYPNARIVAVVVARLLVRSGHGEAFFFD